MADYINNVAAADKYVKELELGPDYQATNAVITIANNPVLMQFAVGHLGNWRWGDEREFLVPPQSFKVGNVVGVRFRNANPGNVARVLAILSGGGDEPVFESGVPFTGTLTASGTVSPAGTLPSGTILPYAGDVAPTGFVFCDGAAYDGRLSINANLWAAIGNKYGGASIASFNVPDLRGRVPVGLGTNPSVNALGQNDGIAVANRRAQHKHTAHTHTLPPMSTNQAPSTNPNPGGNIQGTSLSNAALNTSAVDGGSGNANDAVDAPSYIVINYLIAT